MQLWTPMWIAVRRRSGCGTHSDWGRTGRAIPVWPYQLSSASSSLVRITSQPSQHREIDLRPRLNNRPAFRCAQQTKPQHVTSERTRPSPPSRSTRYIWVSSFCSLMWIARGRTGRTLRCAPASTNTASTPVARTLRICACDRSLVRGAF